MLPSGMSLTHIYTEWLGLSSVYNGARANASCLELLTSVPEEWKPSPEMED
jgi:hypothetical protein